MPRDRKAVAERKRRESLLDRKNEFGFHDPTPYEAMKRIEKEQLSNSPKQTIQRRIASSGSYFEGGRP